MAFIWRLTYAGLAVASLSGVFTGQARAAADGQSDGVIHLAGDISIVSDYRRNGVTRSDSKPAIQGELDVLGQGWSGGVFASTTKSYRGGDYELEVFAGKDAAVGRTHVELSGHAVVFPGSRNANFGFAQLSASRVIGPVDASISAKYWWEQKSLNHRDNRTVSIKARTPVGRVLGAPLTLGAGVGWSQGYFAIEGHKFDWSASAVARIRGLDVGLTYSDTTLDNPRGDPAVVFSLTRHF